MGWKFENGNRRHFLRNGNRCQGKFELCVGSYPLRTHHLIPQKLRHCFDYWRAVFCKLINLLLPAAINEPKIPDK